MANYEAHARTRTVGPRTRTQHGPDRKEQATSHLKNTTSMYVAMLISKILRFESELEPI